MFAIRVNMKMHCILLLLLSTIVASFSSLNDRPVIGVLSTPDDSKSTFYIAASYVKWLESAGARAIAIPFYASDDLIESIFYQVNGILFPGGADYKDMPDSARKIWKLAKTANDSGNYFPLWGTCLGFEFMVMLAASEDPMKQIDAIRPGFNSWNISLPLLFTDLASRSKMFKSKKIRTYAQDPSKNITLNNHYNGIGK
jgi:gamma-glutamyl hydrolase